MHFRRDRLYRKITLNTHAGQRKLAEIIQGHLYKAVPGGEHYQSGGIAHPYFLY